MSDTVKRQPPRKRRASKPVSESPPAFLERPPAVRFNPGSCAPQWVTDDSSVRDFIWRSMLDTEVFARSFLADSFKQPMTTQRQKVLALVHDDTQPKVAVMGYRGLGKTALLLYADQCRRICFRRTKFLLNVGASHDNAANETDNLKSLLITSPAIRDVFGVMKATEYQDVSLKFSSKAFELSDPTTHQTFCFVVPQGALQTKRGINKVIGGVICRPDFIIGGDIENKKNIHNEDIRKEIREWFHNELCGCVPDDRPHARGPGAGKWIHPILSDGTPDPYWTPPWRIFVLANYTHDDALIVNLNDDPEWVSDVLPKAGRRTIIEEDASGIRKTRYEYYSLVPKIYTDSQIQSEALSADRRGGLRGWAMENMCQSVPPDSESGWCNVDFQYYRKFAMPEIQKSPDFTRFIISDPARTIGPRSAFSAFLPVAIQPYAAQIYLRGEANLRISPDEYEETLFDMCDEYNTNIVGIEDEGLHSWIQGWLIPAARKRGKNIHWVWLKTGVSHIDVDADFPPGPEGIKQRRAAGAARLYRPFLPTHPHGHVVHEESLRGGFLESRQRLYPACRVWDIMDCLGHIPQMMTELGISFCDQRRNKENEVVSDVAYQNIVARIKGGKWRAA